MTTSRRWAPSAAQELAVRLLVEQPAAGLLLDPGLGKTSSVLAALKLWRRRGAAKRLLVIAPLRVAELVWPAEAAKWADFESLRVHVLHGKGKTAAALADPDVDIYVINPDGLAWLTQQEWAWPDVLVVDESTTFKHSRTVRFKLLKSILGRFRRRYILTGSPAPNGLLDLFGQIYVLDFGKALGRYITHYRRAYFVPSFDGFSWQIAPGADKLIFDRLRGLVLRLDAQDYLKLPPRLDVDVHVALPTAARRTYLELEHTLVTQLKTGEVTAVNGGARTTKLRQLANGAVYLDDLVTTSRRWEEVHAAKLDALAELVGELSGQPALVAYEFAHDLARIRRRLGASIPALSEASGAKLRELERAWNAGEVPLLALQPQASARGLNLQAGGHTLIWFSLTWDLELHDQLVARIWRQGQRRRVFVYRILARDTVDEDIVTALARKDRTQRTLLDALQRRVARRRPR